MATKTVFIGVRISPLEKAKLDTLAARERVNQSEVLRRLIQRGMTGKDLVPASARGQQQQAEAE